MAYDPFYLYCDLIALDGADVPVPPPPKIIAGMFSMFAFWMGGAGSA